MSAEVKFEAVSVMNAPPESLNNTSGTKLSERAKLHSEEKNVVDCDKDNQGKRYSLRGKIPSKDLDSNCVATSWS